MTNVFMFLLVAFSPAEDKITFDDHIKPIFQQRCGTCHSSARKSGGIDLTNYTAVMEGGGSGTSIEPGDAEGSYLYLLVNHDESPEMPPNQSKIPDAEVSKIAAWINGGALENKGSVARKKKSNLINSAASIGERPEDVAYPLRMSLEPHVVTAKKGLVQSVATSPWAAVTALAGAKQILLYDLARRDYLGALPLPEGRANVLKFSRSGSLLIAGGGRHGLIGKVFGWDVETGNRLFEIGEELDNVLAADISADHSLVALGGPQKMLRVYSSDTESPVYEIKKHTDWVTTVAFSPDGVLLASADRAGGLHLWESETGNEYLTLGGHSKSITSMSWRSDGNVLATVGDDGAVRLWEVENGRQIKSWNAHGRRAAAIEFCRDGSLVTTGSDKLTKLWQQDGKLIRQFKGLSDEGVAVSYCDESKQVVATDCLGKVLVWNADNGDSAKDLESNPAPLAARLQHAQNLFDRANEQHSPLRQQAESIDKKLQELESQIKGQTVVRDRFGEQLEKLNSELIEAKSRIENTASFRRQTKAELSVLRNASPKLKAARDQAVEASELLPDDEALKEISDVMTEKFTEISESIVTKENELKQSESENAAVTTQIAEIQKQVNNLNSNLASAERRIQELVDQQNPLKQKRTDIGEKVSLSAAELAKRQSALDRWKKEIEFHQALVEKNDQLVAVQLEVDGKEQALNEVKTRLNEIQAEFDRATAAKENSNLRRQQVEQELNSLRQRKRD